MSRPANVQYIIHTIRSSAEEPLRDAQWDIVPMNVSLVNSSNVYIRYSVMLQGVVVVEGPADDNAAAALSGLWWEVARKMESVVMKAWTVKPQTDEERMTAKWES
jgi:hypothetical protein